MGFRQRAATSLATALVVALTGCASTSGANRDATSSSSTPAASSSAPAPSATPSPSKAPTEKDTRTPTPSASPEPSTTPGPAEAPKPRRARLSIPSIDVQELSVVPYRGTADDAPGSEIQNGGVAASPHGPQGGVGPGQVGNYIVTAHRLSAGGPFGDLPSVRKGDHILVTSGGMVYDYVVTRSMWVSFRDPESRASQSLPVPGRPGRTATRAMITLSTCATPEDHAVGNYWSDEFDNPEHRIDKVGVLVDVRKA